MSIKATAQVIDSVPGGSPGTFAITIRTVNVEVGSVTNVQVDNIDPDVLESTLQSALIGAVKNYWGLGLLDGVRVL